MDRIIQSRVVCGNHPLDLMQSKIDLEYKTDIDIQRWVLTPTGACSIEVKWNKKYLSDKKYLMKIFPLNIDNGSGPAHFDVSPETK